MDIKRIDGLFDRLKAMQDNLVRVLYADGGAFDVTPRDAILLIRKDRPIMRIHPLGDTNRNGCLLELLNRLCEEDGDT